MSLPHLYWYFQLGNPTNCGERHCIIPANHQEERGGPQRLRPDVSATRLHGGLETTLHVSRTYVPSTSLPVSTASSQLGVLILPNFELVSSEGGTVILIGLVQDELLVLGAGEEEGPPARQPQADQADLCHLGQGAEGGPVRGGGARRHAGRHVVHQHRGRMREIQGHEPAQQEEDILQSDGQPSW